MSLHKDGSRLNLAGDFRGLLRSLRWLSRHGCPSHLKARNLNLVNLLVLDLSRSDSLTEDWTEWNDIKIGNKLKVLNLSYCKSLRRVPDLSKYRSLEKLILQGCQSLIQTDSSIGMLKTLKYLNVRGCDSLRGLPEELCLLANLEEILVQGCLLQGPHDSFTLPRETGNLKSLINLELADVMITELPTSICQLQKLKRLSLRGCPGIVKLPSSLGELTSLVELDISSTKTRELPESVGRIKGLKVMKINRSQIRKVPQSIRRLEKLEELHVDLSLRDILRDFQSEKLKFVWYSSF